MKIQFSKDEEYKYYGKEQATHIKICWSCRKPILGEDMYAFYNERQGTYLYECKSCMPVKID
jgi:hypothetical protein